MNTLTMRSLTYCRGVMRIVRSRTSWRDREAGTAAYRPSSPWVFDRARAQSSFWFSALAQGMFWAGVASTFVMGIGTAITVGTIATLAVGARSLANRFASKRVGYGSVLVRGAEVGAAAVVLTFGVLLLTGYIVSERMVGF